MTSPQMDDLNRVIASYADQMQQLQQFTDWLKKLQSRLDQLETIQQLVSEPAPASSKATSSALQPKTWDVVALVRAIDKRKTQKWSIMTGRSPYLDALVGEELREWDTKDRPQDTSQARVLQAVLGSLREVVETCLTEYYQLSEQYVQNLTSQCQSGAAGLEPAVDLNESGHPGHAQPGHAGIDGQSEAQVSAEPALPDVL